MVTSPTQIRIDAETKREAVQLFSNLGLDLSGAVNLFLRQCVMRNGLPFSVEMPKYNQQTLDAMAEARNVSRNPNIAGYSSMEELKAALNSDV
ncbi:MAG: type II toxin-antitoxin system RelB/DinJ family antitoxin [Synergistaceae bacterium]|nr:type II toxin-antitoxin system RelB/DinJ family antitoxin [Synergistaceae bacterium]